ncbi:MAG: VTT domain-containing protein [bacterium]|nr:VTT domain-containing protein [bacterium]
MSTLELFVINNPHWTYIILFGGMFIEGEAFFLTGALLALQGHLSWPWFIAVIFVGVILGDIVWYSLGRWSRNTKLGFLFSEKFSRLHSWLEESFMSRYQRLAFYSKFLYYINRLTPLIAGWHNMEFKKFAKIHLAAAVFWIGIMSIVSAALGLSVGGDGLRWLVGHLEYVVVGSAIAFVAIEYSLKKIFTKKISIKF